jgi:hypothetical protein
LVRLTVVRVDALRPEDLLDTKSGKTGRGKHTNSKPLQHHDFIDVPSLSKEGISSRAAEFYASGLSLGQISRHLNRSKSFIRKTISDAGVTIRESGNVLLDERTQPATAHSGNTPYGYQSLRGQLILDAKEIEIVHTIMELWTKGHSYSDIVRNLNSQGLTNRKGSPWEHSLVRSIVERHKDKPLNLEEE